MKKFFVTALIIFISVAGTVSSGAAYFETITIPVAGATGGQVNGINDNGDIVGWYYDGAFKQHGYLISGGVFSTIDYNGINSVINGINNNGVVVGTYYDNAGRHGFWYKDGTYNSYDYSGFSGATMLTGINDNGDIIGVYGDGDNDFPFKSFLKSGGSETAIEYAGSTLTSANDINNAGTIVGNLGTWNGFSWDHSGFSLTEAGFTEIEASFGGATATDTYISGINDNGDYVGTYQMMGTSNHSSYLMQAGVYETWNVPGADSTYARDINNNGTIVGGYNVDGLYYGFTCSVPEPSVALLLVFGLAGLSGLRRKL